MKKNNKTKYLAENAIRAELRLNFGKFFCTK